MKLVTYSRDNSVSCAILTEAGLMDIPRTWKGPNPPHCVKEILQRGQACLDTLAVLADSVVIHHRIFRR